MVNVVSHQTKIYKMAKFMIIWKIFGLIKLLFTTVISIYSPFIVNGSLAYQKIIVMTRSRFNLLELCERHVDDRRHLIEGSLCTLINQIHL